MNEQEQDKTTKKEKTAKILKYVIIVVLSVIILAGITYIGMKLYSDYNSKKQYENLALYMKDTIQEESDSEENIPEPEQEEKENVPTERMIKLQGLHEMNNDIVGWIEIADTNINYPILQTNNNDFYLNHNYEKKYQIDGSIFLDKDVNLELPSSNFLMYGHRSEKGAMFEHLMKYAKKDFYESHKTIRITTLQEDAEYEILSIFYSRVYYKTEKNVFRYYYFVNAENEQEYDDFVANAKKVSIYDTGVDAKYGDQLITLSTCEYSQEDGRFAVVAKKIK